MKFLHAFAILAICFASSTITAQKQYTIDGNQYTLLTEVEGPITLLWNTIDDEYRYFLQKDNNLIELKNTNANGVYQEEYKNVLATQTKDAAAAVEDVKFTRPSLASFINSYNQRVDANYQDNTENIKLTTRLGGFAGISNNAYFINPDNTFLPVLGIDFEILDKVTLRRHAILFQFEQLISSSDYAFSSSQLSLSYRFKFVAKETFDLFVGIKGASYIHVSRDLIALDANGEEEVVRSTGGDIRSPGSIGIGADIALGGGYLTVAYNDIVAIGLDKNDEFPINVTVGYKFNL